MIEAFVPDWKPHTMQVGWSYPSEQKERCECRAGRVRWEYRIVQVGDGVVTAVDGSEDHSLVQAGIEPMLTALGAQEWELAAVQGETERALYIFKRPSEKGQ